MGHQSSPPSKGVECKALGGLFETIKYIRHLTRKLHAQRLPAVPAWALSGEKPVIYILPTHFE